MGVALLMMAQRDGQVTQIPDAGKTFDDDDDDPRPQP
jgi:hypothetical protein